MDGVRVVADALFISSFRVLEVVHSESKALQEWHHACVKCPWGRIPVHKVQVAKNCLDRNFVEFEFEKI